MCISENPNWISEISIQFPKTSMVFENPHLNITKSEMYFRNLTSISINLHGISENINCLVSYLYTLRMFIF